MPENFYTGRNPKLIKMCLRFNGNQIKENNWLYVGGTVGYILFSCFDILKVLE
jgi:hypothetical protein